MTRATAIPGTVTVHVPLRVVKRGGRKEMQLPPGSLGQRRADNTLIKALARAFRWKRILSSGRFETINELAVREGIAPSYMTRVLRLTLLAPELIETILDGRQGPELTLAVLLQPFPTEWGKQKVSKDAHKGLSKKFHSAPSGYSANPDLYRPDKDTIRLNPRKLR